MFLQAAAVAFGGAAGALARWSLGFLVNDLWAYIPPGTMFVNILGGYLAGLATPFFLNNPHIAQEWRLLAVTGFLGGLTTFSAFTIDVMTLLQSGRWFAGAAGIALHVAGALAAMALGAATYGVFAR